MSKKQMVEKVADEIVRRINEFYMPWYYGERYDRHDKCKVCKIVNDSCNNFCPIGSCWDGRHVRWSIVNGLGLNPDARLQTIVWCKTMVKRVNKSLKKVGSKYRIEFK